MKYLLLSTFVAVVSSLAVSPIVKPASEVKSLLGVLAPIFTRTETVLKEVETATTVYTTCAVFVDTVCTYENYKRNARSLDTAANSRSPDATHLSQLYISATHPVYTQAVATAYDSVPVPTLDSSIDNAPFSSQGNIPLLSSVSSILSTRTSKLPTVFPATFTSEAEELKSSPVTEYLSDTFTTFTSDSAPSPVPEIIFTSEYEADSSAPVLSASSVPASAPSINYTPELQASSTSVLLPTPALQESVTSAVHGPDGTAEDIQAKGLGEVVTHTYYRTIITATVTSSGPQQTIYYSCEPPSISPAIPEC